MKIDHNEMKLLKRIFVNEETVDGNSNHDTIEMMKTVKQVSLYSWTSMLVFSWKLLCFKKYASDRISALTIAVTWWLISVSNRLITSLVAKQNFLVNVSRKTTIEFSLLRKVPSMYASPLDGINTNSTSFHSKNDRFMFLIWLGWFEA